ncbi:MAG: lysophospholipid acyltransferase family protein [Bdellovibrionaceae bacterium]|jgi:Kdo2-lipid IVA lauroyltransferase/acyltransferase|nr:lysophospholipid acyltransferase family protein [Pseudobdellovibrionaceae bacterium]
MKYLTGLFFKSISWLVHFSPKWFQSFLGDFIGFLWFDLLRIRRKIVLDNIKIAFPDLSYKQRVALGRKSLSVSGRNIVNYSHLPFINKENFKEYVEIENIHHIQEALSKGKGVCLLTLHLGNGDLGGVGLSLSELPVHLISKEFKLKWLNDLWFGVRSRLGVGFIPPRNSSYAILKKLKANEVVIFVLDQFMGPPIGVKTLFFGKETGTAMGLTVMAKRTGAPVIPVYCHERADGKQVVSCESEIEFEEKGEKSETLTYMTQKYTDKLESIIKLYPEQWMWVHRRWKKFS